MEQQSNIFKSLINFSSMSFKIFLIIVLILIMLIPKQMVEGLVHERMGRSDEVIAEVGAKWGGKQVIDGPILTIPVKEVSDRRSYVHIISEELNITSDVKPEVRKKGIFEAILYSSAIEISAKFKVPSGKDLNISESALDLENAVITYGISDPAGIADTVKMTVDGEQAQVKPGISVPFHHSKGFHIPVILDDFKKDLEVTASMKVNGSEQLTFVPSGKNSRIEMKSPWKDPDFTGEFLTSKRNVDDSGFDALWNIQELQSNIKPFWYNADTGKSFPKVGVNLIQVNDAYQRILRVIKYAILFISFTFAAVFISERITGVSIHPLQYLLTGIASLFFYVFLLSISEHFSFNMAYGITSLTITLLIAAYAKGIFRTFKMAYTMGGISSLLYLFLFGTLQMEDYALLMGSTGLLMILAVVMYLTKSINKEYQPVQA